MAKPTRYVVDSLFDNKITPLDVIKILMLIVTGFSTFNIVDIMTPDGTWAWIREWAAVGIVEGAFLGFEYATMKAKNNEQVTFATLGFFVSLTVIAMFAGLSGVLEFGGPSLLESGIGNWAGIAWKVRDLIMILATLTTVAWIVMLASIYRIYDLCDPDKQAELQKSKLNGDVIAEANSAMERALEKATPVIAIERAVARMKKDYGDELTFEQLEALEFNVRSHLQTTYARQLGVGKQTPTALPGLQRPPLRMEPSRIKPGEGICLHCSTTFVMDDPARGTDSRLYCSLAHEIAAHEQQITDAQEHLANLRQPIPTVRGNGNGNGHKSSF